MSTKNVLQTKYITTEQLSDVSTCHDNTGFCKVMDAICHGQVAEAARLVSIYIIFMQQRELKTTHCFNYYELSVDYFSNLHSKICYNLYSSYLTVNTLFI